MHIIIHRVNSIKKLNTIPPKFGVEVDVRTSRNQLILNHEPFQGGDLLCDYLEHFRHAFIILDIKEEGIEKKVIELCKIYGIKNYFLLGVSFPFMFLFSREGVENMAVRYSEFEDIETCLALRNRVVWIWADTFTKNPLNKDAVDRLKQNGFKICFVSPERWGRPHDIKNCIHSFMEDSIRLDAVMVGWDYKDEWNELS